MRRLGPLYGGAVALVHSTSWKWPDTIGGEARSSGWIVALGVPIGVCAWLVAAAAHALGLQPTICALLGLAMLTLASAGIVERGLADRIESAGNRGGGRTLGAASIVALVFITLVRAFAVVSIAPSHWLALFVTTAVAGRWAATFLQALGDPIMDDDAPRSLVATPAPAWLIAALSGAVAALGLLALGKVGLLALVLAAGVSFGLGLDAQRRERGLSGPVVATAAAVGEMMVLLAASAVG
jgi:cobalamin synthase